MSNIVAGIGQGLYLGEHIKRNLQHIQRWIKNLPVTMNPYLANSGQTIGSLVYSLIRTKKQPTKEYAKLEEHNIKADL